MNLANLTGGVTLVLILVGLAIGRRNLRNMWRYWLAVEIIGFIPYAVVMRNWWALSHALAFVASYVTYLAKYRKVPRNDGITTTDQ